MRIDIQLFLLNYFTCLLQLYAAGLQSDSFMLSVSSFSAMSSSQLSLSSYERKILDKKTSFDDTRAGYVNWEILFQSAPPKYFLLCNHLSIYLCLSHSFEYTNQLSTEY